MWSGDFAFRIEWERKPKSAIAFHRLTQFPVLSSVCHGDRCLRFPSLSGALLVELVCFLSLISNVFLFIIFIIYSQLNFMLNMIEKKDFLY